jgi:16S rRNA (guanine(1405)-N(7))-methyltransferase
MAEHWLDRDAGRAALAAIVAAVIEQYRVDATTATRWVRDTLSRDPVFRRTVEAATSGEQVLRTRAYKDAATAAKRHVYYALRTYRPAGTDGASLARLHELEPGGDPGVLASTARAIAECHRSTAERIPWLAEFYTALLAAVGNPQSILDVGCGVQPLLFPFDDCGSVQRYVALDKDPQAVDVLQAYARARADRKLTPQVWDLAQGWPVGLGPFDVALLLKLVGVVERQDREALAILAETPAPRWIVTGSKLALAKQRNIERRERSTLQRFVEQAGRHVIGEFDAGEEFALVVE